MAGKRDRQRKLARARYERQQERRADRARRARLWTVIGVACLVVIGIGVGGYFFLRPGGSNAAASSATATPTATATATATPTPTQVAEPATHCAYTSSPPAARSVGMPPTTPASTATYQATIVTNRGNVVIDLLNSKATCTVNSFVYLAAKNYFSSTTCHRLTTGSLSVLQCGDPTGKGTGGPGYGFANENTTGATYSAGTVAMAHSSLPNSNGSQFFIVYKNSTLSPNYTPFGKVVTGLGIIQSVAQAGSDNANGSGDGHPKEPVVIEKVTIKKT
ncbi:MAG TPA: peptidylprolyl isomerase [Streptosporangiaceae bacterium]